MILSRITIPVIPHPTNIPKDKKLFIDATNPNGFILAGVGIEEAPDRFGFANFIDDASGDRPDYDAGNKEIDFSSAEAHLISGVPGYIFSTSDGLSIFALVKTDSPKSVPDPSYIIDFGELSPNGYGLSLQEDHLMLYTPTSFNGVRSERDITLSNSYRRIAGIIKFGADQDMFINNVSQTPSAVGSLTKLTATEIANEPTRSVTGGPVTVGLQSKTGSQSVRDFGGQMKAVILYSNFINSYFRKQIDIFLQMLESR